MRRTDREVREAHEIVGIMSRCQVVTLGLWNENAPYLLPVNFGMEPDGMVLYIHGAMEGTKYHLIDRDNRVGFNMIAATELILEDVAHNCTMNYESVSGWGVMDEITDEAGKLYALRKILEHYDHGEFPVDQKTASRTRILRLQIRERTGKRRKGM